MEGFASIEKTESLALFELPEQKFSELIFRDTNPFPGYYSEPGSSQNDVPNFAFIALKSGECCYEDILIRAQNKIRESVSYDFEINYGKISFLNKNHPCVRVRIDNFNNLPDLLSHLKKYDIEFEKHSDIKSFEGYIRVRKYVELVEYTENVYTEKDCNCKDMFYVKVDRKLNWNNFVKLILSVRGTGKFNNFDAAMLSLYRKNQIIEFVRVYTKNFTKKDFDEFYKEINRQIKHY